MKYCAKTGEMCGHAKFMANWAYKYCDLAGLPISEVQQCPIPAKIVEVTEREKVKGGAA